MANHLPKEKQILVLKMLVEGNSIRSTERITGVNRNTIMSLLCRFGKNCSEFLDLSLSNVYAEHVQLDEIWTFVGKKDRKLRGVERANPEIGSMYLFLALDTDSKLLITHRLGKRNSANTEAFLVDLERRLVRPPADSPVDSRVQISTDGFSPYSPAVAKAFGTSAKHGVLIKNYVNPESGRYAPPDLRRTSRYSVRAIKDLYTICTSHIERHNLTIRTFMKRFTRLALGFSKKLENLSAAVNLHVAYYNFCWRLRENGNSGKYRPTPAMQSGIVQTLWSIEDLYENVMQIEINRKQDAKYTKLMEKLRS